MLITKLRHLAYRVVILRLDANVMRTLFNERRFSVLWLVLRVWIGYKWLTSGLGKIENPAWVQTGETLKGFWTGSVAVPKAGRPAIAFDWYRNFIQINLSGCVRRYCSCCFGIQRVSP
ncbi:MAG: hypothetical protein IAE79_25120 [Anaerolinea sp.]|nr:hypothetical protein [Anaerolinea sp.]